MDLTFEHLSEWIARLPTAEKLYATLAFYERMDDADIREVLGGSQAEIESLRERTVAAIMGILIERSLVARVARRAEAALVGRLSEITSGDLGRAGRVATLDEAFVPTVGSAERRLAIEDVLGGDGGELRKPTDLSLYPRFHSARSSCALAVNAFGPWRRDPKSLRVGRLDGFTSLEFEAKRPIAGVRGTPPNLDLIADGHTILAVESKLIEYLSVKTAKLAAAYGSPMESAHPSWRARYEELKDDPTAYRLLDAAQLLKHYLGLRAAGRKTVLLYLYWEPTNHATEPVFALHGAEADRFGVGLADPRVRFQHMSYERLWRQWEVVATPRSAHAKHVVALRRRYELAL